MNRIISLPEKISVMKTEQAEKKLELTQLEISHIVLNFDERYLHCYVKGYGTLKLLEGDDFDKSSTIQGTLGSLDKIVASKLGIA